MSCTPIDEVDEFDPDASGPGTPGGGGGTDDDGPEEPSAIDSNFNLVVDTEDPFQKPNSDPVPYELWELPEEGVTKPWTFTPLKTRNGAALFSKELQRVRELFYPYESSGTLKYMPYGNHTLPEGLPMIPQDFTDTFDGVEYINNFSYMMRSPLIDGYRACLFFRQDGPNLGDDLMLTFWDTPTRKIVHAIRMRNQYKELVIDRGPDGPGWNQRGYVGLTGSNGTNLTNSMVGTDYRTGDHRYSATMVQGKDITRIGTGYSGASDTFDPRPYYTTTYHDYSNHIDEWNRYRIGYNEDGRMFCGYARAYATPDEDVVPYGCRSRLDSGSFWGEDYSFHPFTVRLPADIFSVTELDWDVMTWQPAQYARQLYANGLATAESMSMAALATKIDPKGTSGRKYEFEDYRGRVTGIGPLGNVLPYQFKVPQISDNGLRMAVQCNVNFLNQYSSGSPNSTLEFSRTADGQPWTFEGAACDSLYFDPVEFPEDWEAAYEKFHKVRDQWRGSATVMEQPFYDGDTLYIVGHSPKYFNGPNSEAGRFKMWRPDFPNCSFKRSEGMTALSESIVIIPDIISSSARRINEWTPEKCIFLIRESSNVYYHAEVNFVAGTWQKLTESGDEPRLMPERLEHLLDPKFYEFTARGKRDPDTRNYYGGQLGADWPGAYFNRVKVEYNGFTLVGIRDTPLVPNATWGDIWTIGATVVEGGYDLQMHRRAMMGVGEVVAYDSSGTEVWRCEPHDARKWLTYRTDTRGYGREMKFGSTINQIHPRVTESSERKFDPDLEAFLGYKSGRSMVGIDRVSFGDRLFLEGSMLHISHDSLPLGADIPEQLTQAERTKLEGARGYGSNEFWATPKDASNYHLAGYVTLDLTTIPELNP
jgi:hypothetical protein